MSRLFAQADAFIDNEATLDRDQLREWLPELIALKNELELMYYPAAYGTHARPDVEINQKLIGIRRLIGNAELIGVTDDESEHVEYHAIKAD